MFTKIYCELYIVPIYFTVFQRWLTGARVGVRYLLQKSEFEQHWVLLWLILCVGLQTLVEFGGWKNESPLKHLKSKKNYFITSSILHTKIYMWKLNMYGEYTVTTKHNFLPAYQCISWIFENFAQWTFFVTGEIKISSYKNTVQIHYFTYMFVGISPPPTFLKILIHWTTYCME
jgi:hypothetical protein